IKRRQDEEGYYFPIISGDALLLHSHPSIHVLVATLQFMAYEGMAYNSALATLGHNFAKAKNRKLSGEDWMAFGKGQINEMQGILPESLLVNWNSWRQLPLPVLIDTLISCYDLSSDEQ